MLRGERNEWADMLSRGADRFNDFLAEVVPAAEVLPQVERAISTWAGVTTYGCL